MTRCPKKLPLLIPPPVLSLSALKFSTWLPRPLPIYRPGKFENCPARPSAPPYSTVMSQSEEHAQGHHFEYDWIDGVESLEKYCLGGYHPIMIGDMLRGRYRIVDKLGFGGYSTVWLALDTCQHRYVAVKVGIADSNSNEINILRALANPGHRSIPTPLDQFEVDGPNGTHLCYTMTPARCNLREVSFSRLFPLEITRALSGGLTLAIAYMHSQGYVHGDIHLRNVLVRVPSNFDKLSVEQFYEEYGEPQTVSVARCDGMPLPPNVPAKAVIPLHLGKDAEDFLPSDVHILLADLGEAFSPDLENRYGKDCHTPVAMRPPEAHFEPQETLSYAADIWSLATTIWEILGMKAIFSAEFASTDEVISQQIDVLGPIPSNWWMHWQNRYRFFDDNGRPQDNRYVWPGIEMAFEEGVQKYRRKRGTEFDKEEATAIIYLMRRMLAFRPEERPTIEEVLQSEWMVKWALPELERNPQTR